MHCLSLIHILPGMDGLETCKKLREHYPEANIFMVSSMAYDDMIDRAAALGAKGFLFKPFTRETLLEGLRGCLLYTSLAEQVALNGRLLKQIVELDRILNQKLGGEKSLYHKKLDTGPSG